MMESVYYLINKYTAVLYTVLYQNQFFFFDIWSINHFCSGALIIAFARWKEMNRPLTVMWALLVGWEILEITFIYLAIGVFKAETIPDQFTDLVVGGAGGLLAWFISTRGTRLRSALAGVSSTVSCVDVMLSFLIALVWVGFYGYRYNVPFLNSPVVNWLAFLLWGCGLLSTFLIHRQVGRRVASPYAHIVMTWAAYFCGMITLEFIGFNILGIRLLTDEKPLVFGLIHGTATLKAFYLTAPLWALSLRRVVTGMREGDLFLPMRLKLSKALAPSQAPFRSKP